MCSSFFLAEVSLLVGLAAEHARFVALYWDDSAVVLPSMHIQRSGSGCSVSEVGGFTEKEHPHTASNNPADCYLPT